MVVEGFKMEDTIIRKWEMLSKKKYKGRFRITFTYINSEEETFEINEDLTAKTIVSLNNKNQFLYINETIINFNNVIKMNFANLDKPIEKPS
jgi:hypothetical protein